MKLKFPKKTKQITVEQISWGDAPRLRGAFQSLRRTFWPQRPAYENTRVRFDMARQIYRNDSSQIGLGSGFGRPIIDSTVGFMGLPRISSGDEDFDTFLNSALHDYWAPRIQEALRDSLRDSHVIVRIRRVPEDNILVTPEEREACYIESVPPETVDMYFSQEDPTWCERALITHDVEFVVEDTMGVRGAFTRPVMERHRIVEEITPEGYRYWDETAGQWLENLAQDNTWGFVPLVDFFNEWDAALNSGQSDFEPVLIFMRAFHDVLGQGLAAHKYHSIPKVKFKIDEIEDFLMNNFPDSYEMGENGRPVSGTFNGKVNWKGNEILFLKGGDSQEDAAFLEAKSVLGDTDTMLGFLIDCICIAGEIPKSVLGLDVGAADKNEMLPFIKKIERKRKNFQEPIQKLLKMCLSIQGFDPRIMPLEWDEITADELVTRMQAFEFEVMGLEVLSQRRIISDVTYRETVRKRLAAMKGPKEEAEDAKGNFTPELLVPPAPNGNGGQSRVRAGQQGRNE